jgi:hypothetical protein
MRKTIVAGLTASGCVVGGVLLWSAIAEPQSVTFGPIAQNPPPIIAMNPVNPEPPATLVSPADLTHVQRRLREPANLAKPRYCLLVFGRQADTSVWMVEDGDRLYVDRKATGDLTDAADAVPATEHRTLKLAGEGENSKPIPYREATFSVGDITPHGRPEKHTQLKVTRFQKGSQPAEYVVSVQVGDNLSQYAGWGPIFSASRKDATVIHFGGPVMAKALRGSSISRGTNQPEIHFCIGTPGIGNHSFAYVSYEALPRDIRPVVQIAWPSVGPAIRERFELAQRC